MTSDLDRLKAIVFRLLRPFLTQLDYSALYGATVVAQNGDGTLELKSASPKLANLSRVKIRYGVPGITAKVANGGTVLVGFENASPDLPFALVYDQATIVSISLADGTSPIARLGDSVTVFMPPAIPFAGTVGGAPATGVMTIVSPMIGIITTGNPKAQA